MRYPGKSVAKVPPRAARHDRRNAGLRQPVVGREFALADSTASVASTDVANLLSGQLGARVAFAPRLPALGVSVPHIVLVRAQEEMVGVDTPRGVAPMAHAQVRRDRSVRKFVGHPVCLDRSPVYAQKAVALPARHSLPEPAGFGLLDTSPESFIDGLRLRLKPGVPALAGAEPPEPTLCDVAPDTESRSAHLADALDLIAPTLVGTEAMIPARTPAAAPFTKGWRVNRLEKRHDLTSYTGRGVRRGRGRSSARRPFALPQFYRKGA